MADKIRVLLVDDELLMRNSLAVVISAEADMDVIGVAENGREALTFMESPHPDIVLIDVRMPIMNGIECIRHMRQLGFQGVILILTSFNEEQYLIEGLAAGANGYLLKGLEFPALIQTIRDAASGNYFLPIEVAAKLVAFIHKKG